jgi:hypothetical protein
MPNRAVPRNHENIKNISHNHGPKSNPVRTVPPFSSPECTVYLPNWYIQLRTLSVIQVVGIYDSISLISTQIQRAD